MKKAFNIFRFIIIAICIIGIDLFIISLGYAMGAGFICLTAVLLVSSVAFFLLKFGFKKIEGHKITTGFKYIMLISFACLAVLPVLPSVIWKIGSIHTHCLAERMIEKAESYKLQYNEYPAADYLPMEIVSYQNLINGYADIRYYNYGSFFEVTFDEFSPFNSSQYIYNSSEGKVRTAGGSMP